MKLKKNVFCILIFIFTTSLFAESLRLVTFEYPPYEYTQNGEVKGIAIDIIKFIFKEMNQPITIEVITWQKAIYNIKEGHSDAIFTFYKNSEREKLLDYSEVLIPQSISLFVRKNSPITYNGNLNELSRLKIGVVKKVSYGKLFDDAMKNNVFKRTTSVNLVEHNFQKLFNRRVDVVPSNKYVGLYILKKLGKSDEVKELPNILETVSSHIAFSKKRKLSSLRDKFDVILRRIKTDGTYIEIIESYLKK